MMPESEVHHLIAYEFPSYDPFHTSVPPPWPFPTSSSNVISDLEHTNLFKF